MRVTVGRIDQFASANEIKAAYKKLSLQLHPDKQTFKTAAERQRAVEHFHRMTEAHSILSDLATRRQYDQARDKLEAGDEAGLMDVGKVMRPPPTCRDVEVTLEQLCERRPPSPLRSEHSALLR